MGKKSGNGHATSEDILDQHDEDLDNVLKIGLTIPPGPDPDTPNPVGDKPANDPDLPVGDKPPYPTGDGKAP